MIAWLAGIFVGFIIHESAHVAVANHYGGDISFNQNIKWTYRGPNLKGVALAGLAAQAITSEILIRREQNNFTKGWLAFNVGNTLLYTIENESRKDGYGDLSNFSRDEARQIETVLLIHSTTVAQRMKWQFFPTRNGFKMRWRL